jgi:hypothetical protein
VPHHTSNRISAFRRATAMYSTRRTYGPNTLRSRFNLRSTLVVLTLLCVSAFAQIQLAPDDQQPINTTGKRWDNFLHETAGPITAGGGAFNAIFSQVTDTDPKYGTNGDAFAKRLGASYADIAAQNFFGDFLMASAFHEDPRYYRKGPGHSLLYRFGYAISRAAVIRTDDGRNGFNFDDIFGSALSAGFSNLYYPPASRTGGAILSHFAIDVADNGFVNLAPEFWPDFRRKVFGHHHHHD